jgi:hypothetical protein
MTCSKIFPGDLPAELTKEIIQYFRKDFSTLYSCILVNRLWCRLAISLLWENPFSLFTRNHHYKRNDYYYIEIYLCYLNEESKVKLNEFGINNDLLPSNTLFNYPSFIKYLNTMSICNSIQKWVETLKDNDYMKIKKLVFKSLFEVFIANEGILHSFEVEFYYNDSCCIYFNDAIELILQNPNFIYNIRNLKFQFRNSLIQNSTNIISFLKFLCFNCNSISSITYFSTPNNDNPLLIENYFSQIIISQHNLKIITFGFDTILYNPFLALKNSNCSNTLNTIIFEDIDFKNIIPILQEVFDQLNVLESIHILYCYSLNSDFVQQIIKVIKPFKLKSLIMKQILHIESLQLLLQKSGNYLENFGFRFMRDEYKELRQQLLRLIIKYCTNIRYFTSCIPDINTYLLIENTSQTINYLNIDFDVVEYGELCSIVLQNLGQVLPSKLEYLCLSFSFRISDFEIFLKNSQDTFIKKLLIKNMVEYNGGESILSHIKEYIMKEERVKYLAYLDQFDFFSGCDLFSFEDEVNEFKLHNIIVQKYSDLYITETDIIHNIT